MNTPTEAQLKADWSQAPEWDGEGLPPVGCQCERFIGDDVYRVTVVAHFDGEVVVHQEDAAPEYTGVDPGYLRPLRTKEQRERDELAKLIDDFRVEQGSFWTPEKEADAIIAAGWHKSKGEPGIDDSPRARGFLCGEAYRRLPDEEKASMEWQAHAERIIYHLCDAGMLRKAGGE